MAMTKIRINGKAARTDAATLGELARELGLPERGVALAMDGRMIPRQRWTETGLSDGSEVIIIKATQGG